MIDKINCIGQKVKCPYCENTFEIEYAEKCYIKPRNYRDTMSFPNINDLEYKLVVSCSSCGKGVGEVANNGNVVLDSKEFVENMKRLEIETLEKHRKMFGVK